MSTGHRLHLLGLPHTQTTDAYSVCAYTQKIRKFATMMQSIPGNEVILYAGEDNEATAAEHVTCITRAEQAEYGFTGPETILKAKYDPAEPYWKHFNARCADEVSRRVQPGDFLLVIAGLSQKPVVDEFPGTPAVEWGVGYSGVFCRFKVFESYAWMHMLYGALSGGEPTFVNGNFYDTVIPNFFEADYFPYVPAEGRGDYYLYMGRLIERKGYQIAADTCRELGVPLLVAGEGTPPKYGEYLGVVGPRERAKLMSHARAVFMPTVYVEPYGAVSAEAMLCGTPVITTDWGAPTEYVLPGRTGWRCRTLGEFMQAARLAPHLDNKKIHDYAVRMLSTETIKWRYQHYLNRLVDLRDGGFYNMANAHGIHIEEW